LAKLDKSIGNGSYRADGFGKASKREMLKFVRIFVFKFVNFPFLDVESFKTIAHVIISQSEPLDLTVK
jgi:hypothetical protein